MITDVLLEHRWLMPALLLVLVVVGPPVGAGLVGRPRLARLLLGLALIPVAVLTLVPTGTDAYPGCAVAWSFPTPGRVELFANLVLFVPPALLAGVATRRPVVVFLVATALSGLVEAAQALIPALGRSCDTTDLFCNALGAAVGSALAALGLLLARRRGESVRPGRS